MQDKYQHQIIEQYAQEYWQEHKSFVAAPSSDKAQNFYCLAMFPYPSGKLHIGHVRNYAIPDVIARFKRMQGFNVLHPMGWDAFGLPAENAAIANATNPKEWTQTNIDHMRTQLQQLGLGYSWDRELATCNSDYYGWEQWFFIQLYNAGLVYKKNSLVNWCEHDNTVLANEQVIDGCCWRCDNKVEQKNLSQWFIKITEYADALLEDLKLLEGQWPDSVIHMQTNWIGKSTGSQIIFKLCDIDASLEVFTTRADTLMGASYLAIAPTHPLALQAAQLSDTVEQFIASCKQQSVAASELATIEKQGIATGFMATHPLTGKKIPVWIANFVLMEYGSGAVMSVPAHDQRDWEFAKKYNLPIDQVIAPTDSSRVDLEQAAFAEQGILINSAQFDGLTSKQAQQQITAALEHKKLGNSTVNYRLRDWGISRQRYWGTPIPIIYCDQCGAVPCATSELPVKLPTNITLDKPHSPLADIAEFYVTTCPQCGAEAKRETDTLDTFVESSWYYLAYAASSRQPGDNLWQDKQLQQWMPVDQYVGGIEHAILHLLYARFFHKVSIDILAPDNKEKIYPEPFKRLLTQGMVLKDGAKMSKSKGNVVDPDKLIELYGADTVRLFILFAAPPTQSLEWSDTAVLGCHRFLNKVWSLVYKFVSIDGDKLPDYSPSLKLQGIHNSLRRKTHETLAKITDDIERRQTFNTAIAAMMELTNSIHKAPVVNVADYLSMQEALEILVLGLSPFTPHICHSLWYALGHTQAVDTVSWPVVDKSAMVSNTTTVVVQINGKLRAKLELAVDTSKDELEQHACAAVADLLVDKEIKKTIVVANKLVNLVI